MATGERTDGPAKSGARRANAGRAPALRVAVVVPCYRVSTHVLGVLSRIGDAVDLIYVVDDKCPEQSGKLVQRECTDPRVRVLFHESNQGVGGAVVSGFKAAIADGVDIIVKIDGDGQMDPAMLPRFIRPIAVGEADFTKGNRFYDPIGVKSMPAVRLIGNAALSLMTKLSSGYWNVFDPTNGFIAADMRLVAALRLDRIDRRYFFESDLLFRIGLLQAKVLDIPMTAHYAGEQSSLQVGKIVLPFLGKNLRNFGKRIFYNYFLRDFNLASLELVLGIVLLLFGSIYGLVNFGGEQAAPAGVVMLAALPFLTGVMMLLSFVNFDTQRVPREPISPRLALLKQDGG